MKDLYGELFCYTRFDYWFLICGLSFAGLSLGGHRNRLPVILLRTRRIGPETRPPDSQVTAGLSGFHKFCSGLSCYQKFAPSLRNLDSPTPDSNQSPNCAITK